jgi:hypothetical protein
MRLREILMRGGHQQDLGESYAKKKFSTKGVCSQAFERVTSFT